MTQTLQCLGPNGYQVVVAADIFSLIAQVNNLVHMQRELENRRTKTGL